MVSAKWIKPEVTVRLAQNVRSTCGFNSTLPTRNHVYFGILIVKRSNIPVASTFSSFVLQTGSRLLTYSEVMRRKPNLSDQTKLSKSRQLWTFHFKSCEPFRLYTRQNGSTDVCSKVTPVKSIYLLNVDVNQESLILTTTLMMRIVTLYQQTLRGLLISLDISTTLWPSTLWNTSLFSGFRTTWKRIHVHDDVVQQYNWLKTKTLAVSSVGWAVQDIAAAASGVWAVV